MRLFYVFTFCRQQVRNEPAIAHLRMFLLLGVTAAAVVLQELKLEPRLKRSKTLASQLDALGVKPGDIKGMAISHTHPGLTGSGNHIQRSISTHNP